MILTSTQCTDVDVTSSCIMVNSVGLEELEDVFGIRVYPNPAHEILSVFVEKTSLKQLTVTDLNGKILSQQSVSGNTSEINVNDLSSGVYLVNIVTENGTAVKQFVKQ